MAKRTIIVFSGDYDRAMAAFVIANGAAAMDDEVTMFFTFWGLSLLRQPTARRRGSAPDLVQRAFAALLPQGLSRLPLSRFNFGGVGPRLMRGVIRRHGVMGLEQLLASAREQGVRLVACTTSMEILGLGEADLVDDIEYAGVASYLADASDAGMNLFI